MEKVKLGEICDFHSGNAWKADEFSNSGVPIIRINNLNQNDGDFVYWNQDYDEKYLVQKDDILLSLSGTIKVYKWHGTEALLNQRIVKIKPKKNTNIDWVYYKISHSIEEVINKAKSATIKNVSVNDIKSLDVLLPDLETQNKIVAILDKAKAILDKREETIKMYDELLKATFLEMFGIQNPNFNYWKNVSVGSLGKNSKSFRTGPFGSSLKHDRFKEEGEVAVLGIDNAVDNVFKWKKKRYLSKDEFDEFKRYQVFPKDVIITIMGTVGRSAVIPDDIGIAINTKHLAAITLDETKCNPYYFAYSIHSNPYIQFQLKARARGAVMDGFNLTLIKELKLKDAPIELQNRFEQIYIKCTTNKEKLTTAQSNAKVLFDALSQLSFKGGLDFGTAVDLEVLLENDFEFFKENSNTKSIQLLIERLNTNELNENKFYEQQTYDKAKSFVFELIKEGKVKQVFDEKTKKVTLTV
ncbi:MAG: restriction endonuclease subunit S [Flammeovirgaceae bacterium]|jgi:type I restriction enzyme S subunit|nr:restriction endonuclease subunit S [Flammeovirgaceae bacterium]